MVLIAPCFATLLMTLSLAFDHVHQQQLDWLNKQGVFFYPFAQDWTLAAAISLLGFLSFLTGVSTFLFACFQIFMLFHFVPVCSRSAFLPLTSQFLCVFSGMKIPYI